MRIQVSNIASLEVFKAKRLRAAVEDLAANLSPDDLHTLQNDVLVAPERRSILPASMAGDFREWLPDSYGPMEREVRMAPEHQAETETTYLEEMADGDDATLAAMATQLLHEGRLGRRANPAFR